MRLSCWNRRGTLKAIRLITRMLGGCLGLLLLLLGGMGWVHVAAEAAEGEGGFLQGLDPTLLKLANSLADSLGGEGWTGEGVLGLLGGSIPGMGTAPAWVLPGLGFLVLLASAWPRASRVCEEAPGSENGEEDSDAESNDPALSKSDAKELKKFVDAGELDEAAEFVVGLGCRNRAVQLFVEAENYSRAADMSVIQGRHEDAAKYYGQADEWEKAGKIFLDQNDFMAAAECYEKGGKLSTAAETYEKAGSFLRAGNAYHESEQYRHAAHSYVRCQHWLKAAETLELVISEEADSLDATDPQRVKSFRTVVLQAGKLYEQADFASDAIRVLQIGKCHGAAAEIASRCGEHEQAAELYLTAGNVVKAADAYIQIGNEHRANEILGEYYRNNGEDEKAAVYLEKAGDFFAAAELYRVVEAFEQSAACFERNGDAAQAAEMYVLAGDRQRAAENYETAERFTEAAECYAELGDLQREVELLERAGNFLRVGQAFQSHGQLDEAIAVLQRVEAESPDYVEAASLLGELFRGKGMFPLAIKKLQEIVGDQPVSKENIHLQYSLCLVYEDDSRFQDAAELLEKVLTCDYKYKDAEAHLGHCQEQSTRVQEAEAKAVESVTDSSGRYQIVGELGRGGMGIVFKSEDTVLDRLVAYKVLPNELRENPKALKNFLREAKSAAQLNHPNIVTVYDAGEQDGRFYIAMEHVEGTTLKEILRSRGAISPAGTRHVLIQVCEALAFAHEKKIVHRDIKPANIMWTGEKQAKIMDFGLAKVIEEVRNHTTVVAGTPYYMSPEQTLGKNVDYRTDIYSLGVTLFELATGELPFKEGNVPYHHVHTPTPDPRTVNPKLPLLLAKIILKCMEKDPDKRYQTAREIVTEIKAAMARQKKKSAEKTNPTQ